MLQSMRKHGITLALFAAGSTGLTAAINELTKSTIEDQAAQQQKALFDQVMPAALYNNDLLKSCYQVSAPELGKGQHKIWIAQDGEKPVAAVMEATAPDGLVEAYSTRIGTAPVIAVQWHPEWNADSDPVSRPLFQAFGAAVAQWATDRRARPAVLRQA